MFNEATLQDVLLLSLWSKNYHVAHINRIYANQVGNKMAELAGMGEEKLHNSTN